MRRACTETRALCVVVTLLTLGAPGAAHGNQTDARAVGLGGCSLLHQLVDSPGAPVGPGLALQCGTQLAYVGSGLTEHHVLLQHGRARHAWALGAAQAQSTVHARTRLALVAQGGSVAWRCGVSVAVASTHFEGYAPWRDVEMRLGIGGRWRAARAAGVAGRVLGAGALPRFAAAMSWQLVPALQAQVQIEREPGVPVRTRAGGVWGSAGHFAVLGGVDVATFGASGGLMASAGAWRFTYGTQSHPDLGWSHAWSLEFRR